MKIYFGQSNSPPNITHDGNLEKAITYIREYYAGAQEFFTKERIDKNDIAFNIEFDFMEDN